MLDLALFAAMQDGKGALVEEIVVTSRPGRPRVRPAGVDRVEAGDLRVLGLPVQTIVVIADDAQNGASAGAPEIRSGFVVTNEGSEPDRLLSISTLAADRVTFWLAEDEPPADSVTVPLEVGSIASRHVDIRLEGGHLPANPDDGIPLTLQFERTGSVVVRVFAEQFP